MGSVLIGESRIVQENEPGIPAQLVQLPLEAQLTVARPLGARQLEGTVPFRRRAYFGGVLESGGGVVPAPLGLVPAGGVVSAGGMVLFVPGAVDWSVEEGAVEVSAGGGELAAPPGEADSCFEQAERSASKPEHNNRTLRFIGSPR